jgi:hypothetical protein
MFDCRRINICWTIYEEYSYVGTWHRYRTCSFPCVGLSNNRITQNVWNRHFPPCMLPQPGCMFPVIQHFWPDSHCDIHTYIYIYILYTYYRHHIMYIYIYTIYATYIYNIYTIIYYNIYTNIMPFISPRFFFFSRFYLVLNSPLCLKQPVQLPEIFEWKIRCGWPTGGHKKKLKYL